MARALGAEERKDGAANVDGSPEVRVDLMGELFRRDLFKGAHETVPCVVHYNIDAAKLLYRVFNDVQRCLRPDHVQRRYLHAIFVGIDQSFADRSSAPSPSKRRRA